MADFTKEIDRYLHRLFPICRSLTGEGNRESLRILQEIAPFEIFEFPSGTKVFDWTIPKEWEIRDAYIKGKRKERLIDFKDSNLHVMGYSHPVRGQMTLNELTPHLYYKEDLPCAIPYRTSYYKEDWGFCLSYEQYKSLVQDGGPFEVLIDSSFKDGSLTVGELLIEGKTQNEILISTYICHPSLANDNLSGMVLTAFLAKELLSRKNLNCSYRIIFVPETIGAIAYCAMNEKAIKEIDIGLVVTTVGGPGKFGYKQSFNEDHPINSLIEETFRESGHDFVTYPFDIHGSDERQYSSPGFRVNTATICKDKYYEYSFYHTSLDNLELVRAEYIQESLDVYLKLIDRIEVESDFSGAECEKLPEDSSFQKSYFLSRCSNCEVMLSKRGLYPEVGGGLLPGHTAQSQLDLILWLLFYCDGSWSIEQISRKIRVPVGELTQTALLLEEKGLLERLSLSCP